MRYATGAIELTELIERASMDTPFVVPVSGKEAAHRKMRDAHAIARRKNCKVTTSVLRAVDIADYEHGMTLVKITVVDRWVVGALVEGDESGHPVGYSPLAPSATKEKQS